MRRFLEGNEWATCVLAKLSLRIRWEPSRGVRRYAANKRATTTLGCVVIFTAEGGGAETRAPNGVLW